MSLPLPNIETKIMFVVGVSWDEGEGVRLVYDESKAIPSGIHGCVHVGP